MNENLVLNEEINVKSYLEVLLQIGCLWAYMCICMTFKLIFKEEVLIFFCERHVALLSKCISFQSKCVRRKIGKSSIFAM